MVKGKPFKGSLTWNLMNSSWNEGSFLEEEISSNEILAKWKFTSIHTTSTSI